MLRSCYVTTMRFPGVGDVPVQWYWCDKDAQPLPFPTVYNSRNWINEGERGPNVPGEIEGAPRKWANGKNPHQGCDKPKGSADAWIGKPSPLLVCVPRQDADVRMTFGVRCSVTIEDSFSTGGGGGEGGGEGTFASVLVGQGGGEGGGEGTFDRYWSGEGGGEGGGEGTFASVLVGQGGGEGGGEGTFNPEENDMPIGAIYWFGSTTPPADHLVCDGSAVSRSTYATLFAIVGTTFGAGDGSTTFTLPNLASRSVVGSGTGSGLSGRTLAATGGEENHVLSTAEIPAHTHPQDAATVIGPGSTRPVDVGLSPNTALGGTTQSSGGGGGHNTMHPFIVLVPIIRYQ